MRAWCSEEEATLTQTVSSSVWVKGEVEKPNGEGLWFQCDWAERAGRWWPYLGTCLRWARVRGAGWEGKNVDILAGSLAWSHKVRSSVLLLGRR